MFFSFFLFLFYSRSDVNNTHVTREKNKTTERKAGCTSTRPLNVAPLVSASAGWLFKLALVLLLPLPPPASPPTLCVIKGLECASVFARAAKCLIAACRRVPPFEMAVRRKETKKEQGEKMALFPVFCLFVLFVCSSPPPIIPLFFHLSVTPAQQPARCELPNL